MLLVCLCGSEGKQTAEGDKAGRCVNKTRKNEREPGERGDTYTLTCGLKFTTLWVFPTSAALSGT